MLFLAIIPALAITITPLQNSAADEGDAGFDIEWNISVQVGSLAELKAAILAADNDVPTSIELTADITFTAAADMITIPANKIIQLTSADVTGAPFSIDADEFSRDINVDADGTLDLRDILITGGNASGSGEAGYGGGILNKGTLILDPGAMVTGDTSSRYGGGVYNTNTFVMNEGAEVSGNESQTGAGVMNASSTATFTLNGGKICNNTATDNAGGVYNSGNFTMSGGEISGHMALSGAGVYNLGTFEMIQEGVGKHPKIINNAATNYGGGVYNSGSASKFNMSGGTISGNTADREGGGVYVTGYAVFNMSGGSISCNKAIVIGTGSTGFGGGLCGWNGTVNMSGGEISDNEAVFGGGMFIYLYSTCDLSGNALIENNKGLTGKYSAGGGVYNYGLLTLRENAAIIGNSAPWGGAVFNEAGTFTMESGMIYGNYSTTGEGGGIYLNTKADPDSNIKIKGGIISSNTAVSVGGGIWANHGALSNLSVAEGVIFADNAAASPYSRDPIDDILYETQIGKKGSGVTWTSPFTQGYNNFDIGYVNGTKLAFVTFMQNHSDTDDTVIEKILVETNAVLGVQMPSDPSRAGYDFAGWNTARDGSGDVYDDSDPQISGNTVLYAQWEQQTPPPQPPQPPATKYKVTYNGNGNTSGTVSIDSRSYLRGDTVTVLGQGDLLRTDFIFLGWATSPGASVATYSPGDSFRIMHNTTLYAVWQLNPAKSAYTVTFVDWDDTLLKTEQVVHGGSATAPADPSREGYVFVGWDKLFDNVTSDLTVRAIYEVAPDASPATGEWAVLNLILVLIGIIIAVIAVIRAVRKGKDEGETARTEERGFAWPLISAIAAIVGIVFFFLTEDVSLPMAAADEWTVISILIFVVAIVAAVLAVRRNRAAEQK
jgi:uncharacterized repeat protein (TIGR02543 family)